jgi:hypothetical protein
MTKLWMSAVVGGVLALVGATGLAQAQRAPAQAVQRWCYQSPDGMTDCSYDTLAQCKASRPLQSYCYRGRRSQAFYPRGSQTVGRSQGCITSAGYNSCNDPNRNGRAPTSR